MLEPVSSGHNFTWLTDKLGDKSKKLVRTLPETNYHPKVVPDGTTLLYLSGPNCGARSDASVNQHHKSCSGVRDN